ncbi:MAG: Smr/MutS family protein [Deltaproteobacteria bacterium]|nr:Smr/MutS family protein [Deltaproteobacteria bacterium]
MAARDPKKGGEVPPRDSGAGPGFNAPFRELGTSLRKRLPARPVSPAHSAPDRRVVASASSTAVAEAANVAGVAAAPTPPAPAPISEAEAFAEATRGVSRIRSEPRVRSKEPPDFGRIAAGRREDLADLAGAVGFDVAFHDHYVRGRADGVSRETLSNLEKGGFAVAAHLDLHGMVLEDAQAAVDEFLKEQQRRGHRCVLLVTGKGRNSPGQQGVLREKVPEWLARGPSARRVLAFVSARPCDGGVGALYVLMRSTSSRKNRIDVEFGGVGSLEP